MSVRSFIFKTVDGIDLKGDLYQPKNKGLRPAVLVVHGGGWRSRAGDMKNICKQLVKSGYVVFNTTYRLAPKTIFPKAVEDVQDALKWLILNAEKYNVDKNRIAGWGYSAGAHLILLAGLNPKMGLKAIVSGGTPADLTVWPASPLVIRFLGFQKSEKPEIWKAASPIYNVHQESPPVFLYHGKLDLIVSFDQMEKMRAALVAKNRVVETRAIPFLGHLAAYFFGQEAIDHGIDFINGQLKVSK